MNIYFTFQFPQIKVDEINSKWKGTIILGAVNSYLNSIHLPSSAILLRRPCWIVTHDYISINGSKIQSKLGEPLLKIQKDTVLTLTLTHTGSLTLQMGEKYLEEIATGLPHHVYPIFDLYGRCERISLINPDIRNGSPINEEVTTPSMLNESDRNVPQLEKADLEVHEKETDISQPSISCEPGSSSSTNGAMYMSFLSLKIKYSKI